MNRWLLFTSHILSNHLSPSTLPTSTMSAVEEKKDHIEVAIDPATAAEAGEKRKAEDAPADAEKK